MRGPAHPSGTGRLRPDLHHDVVVVGAGLAGVGAACRLLRHCPGLEFVVFERRGRSGGTWDLYRYPGVRSDSDMYTLAYPFRPWRDDAAVVDGDRILAYIRDTAAELGVEESIRYDHRVRGAEWDSTRACWRIRVDGRPDVTAGFVLFCTGYYDYDAPHRPSFPGEEGFGGRVVHPQSWPADLDVGGRRVVVVGNGATAVSVVPALAARGAHVTMLQRSPGYLVPLSRKDRPPPGFGLLPLPWRDPVRRWGRLLATQGFYAYCRLAPGAARARIRAGVAASLPDGWPLDPDFSPRYAPWDQRVCLDADAELLSGLADGRLSVCTDTVTALDPGGVTLASGRRLPADVVVVATGLTLRFLGGARLTVDGRTVEPGEAVVHRGCLLAGVPNLAFSVGYVNASWTLRADLSARLVCGVLDHMRRHGFRRVEPPNADGSGPTRPILPLHSGYVLRNLAAIPRQGSRGSWRFRQNYPLDALDLAVRGPTRGLRFA